jgi:Fuc2NAc and GlcNAc transferase
VTAVLITFLLSVLLCGLYMRFALARRLFDVPNERSSHTQPTPGGGGATLVSAFLLGLVVSAWLYGSWDGSLLTLAVAALGLTVVGVIDDLRGLSILLRLAVYGAVCLLVATALMHAEFAENPFYGGLLVLFAAFGLVWSLNLYNFMDGIDGIAALQAVLACSSAALLSWGTGHGPQYPLYCLLFAAAHCGFLIWNYPPARLFMGDAGSVPTGFLLGALALTGAQQGLLNPLCWLVLLAAFITDATWTLVWRAASGQDVTQPHRLHAYQRLSRYWGSHSKVDMLLLAINTVWLLPLAAAVQMWPEYGPFMVILAYLPLLGGMAKIARLA